MMCLPAIASAPLKHKFGFLFAPCTPIAQLKRRRRSTDWSDLSSKAEWPSRHPIEGWMLSRVSEVKGNAGRCYLASSAHCKCSRVGSYALVARREVAI